MSKFNASIESIECGNKILEMVYPILLQFEQNKEKLSQSEQVTYNTMLGSQLALVCEYYLKGLLIPNMQVIIPEELKDKIPVLTQEQELMIIVSDEEKIKADPILGRLDKKQLRLLLNSNSLKNIGHSLICLLGSKTLTNNKAIRLPEILRKHIIESLKSKLYDAEAKTLKEREEFRQYILTPIQGTRGIDRLEVGDKIIEEEISKSSVSDAFPKGRYGMFDGFVSNVDWISELAFSIREEIKHQYPNMIEILKSKKERFGKFIYPDEESLMYIENARGETIEYEMVPEIHWYGTGIEVFWNVSRTTETEEDKKVLDVLKKYDEDARVSSEKIYLEEVESGNQLIIKYIQAGQMKYIKLVDGMLYEIFPESINKDENNVDTHEER